MLPSFLFDLWTDGLSCLRAWSVDVFPCLLLTCELSFPVLVVPCQLQPVIDTAERTGTSTSTRADAAAMLSAPAARPRAFFYCFRICCHSAAADPGPQLVGHHLRAGSGVRVARDLRLYILS